MKGQGNLSLRSVNGPKKVTRKGDLLCQKWYIKSKGLDLGAEPPNDKILFSTPPGKAVILTK